MLKIRLILLLTTILLLPALLRGQTENLAKTFINPPAQYSITPFWSWNGTLKPEKLKWQIDQMLEKGVSGAFMHARAGLDESETPYFSKGFWDAVDTTVRYSASKGFYPHLYDEDKWPSGSAGGRTIAANPDEFTKKILVYSKMEVAGPQLINLNLQQKPLAVFAGRISDKGKYDFLSQINLTDKANQSWQVPEGRWVIISFRMIKDPGGQIDYLDSAAVAKFIEVTHEQYFKHVGKYFGNTIPGVFFDEIYANGSSMEGNIFWTDDFLSKFKQIKGYDLRDKLPLIIYSDPGKSEPVRYDYFDVVKDLYVKAWFKQYADWCAAHKIWVTGHTTELLLHYKRQSDYFSTMGQLQVPGTDNEEYRYGYPRLIEPFNPKQISSIGHLYNHKRVMAESMGGGGYTIPLEEYKYGFSMLGVYGVNMYIPHLFHYSVDSPETQSDWPPSWFYQNPYWKYFKPLADFARRTSYLNSQGRAVCDVAVLFPLTDLWEDGYPDRIDDRFYKEVQQNLLDSHIDYDVIDPASLARAKIDGNKIVAGTGHYRVLVLPSIQAIRSDVLQQITSFVEKGGIVIGLKNLPVRSETGPAGDELVSARVKELFGFHPSDLRSEDYYQWNTDKTGHFTVKTNKANGSAYFTRFLNQLSGIINTRINPDFVVKSDNAQYLQFNHRQIANQESYLLVNDRNAAEKYHISLRNIGEPSVWNPETGTIHPVQNYEVKDNRTDLILDFKPRESYFLVLDSSKPNRVKGLIENTDLIDFRVNKNEKGVTVDGWGKSGQKHAITLKVNDQLIKKEWTNQLRLPEINLSGNWQFQLAPRALDYTWSSQLESDTLELPIMKFQPERTTGDGSINHWPSNDFIDTGWNTVKITDKFNAIPGIQRYLSAWDACWISYYDYSVNLPAIEGGNRTFRKEIWLDTPVNESGLAITADQGYELRVNGELIGSDKNWKTAKYYELSASLRQGNNILEVKTINTRGLLMQGFIRLKEGKSVALRSDESWMVSTGQSDWQPAFRFAAPPLGSWGNIVNPLQKLQFPLTVWYRQQLPPGVKAIRKPVIKGKYSLYINGIPANQDQAGETIDIARFLKDDFNTIALSVVAADSTCGLLQPLQLVCGKSNQPLIPWNEMGLGWYSGRAIYSKKVTIPDNYLQDKTRLILDLGQVDYFAEVWVNHKLVTFFPWGPYNVDISHFLNKGENEISVVVANLLANRATWNILDGNISNKDARWWQDGSIMREKEKLTSGLLGPVRIIPYRMESVKLVTN